MPSPSGDLVQLTWFLSWPSFALSHGFGIFHTNFLDYPGGVNLATNPSMPLLGVIAAPLVALAGPVVAMNVMLHLALAGSAWAMFLVLRSWTRWWPAAFAGGLLYGFGPFAQYEGSDHLDLCFLVVPPVFLWCLERVVVSRRIRPVPGGVALGLLAAAQYLVNVEIWGDMLMFGLLALVLLGISHPRTARARAPEALVVAAVAAVCFLVVAGYPLWLLLEGPGHLRGPFESARVTASYRLNLLAPVVQGADVPLVRHGVVSRWHTGSGYLGPLLVGWLVVLVIRCRRVGAVQLAAALAVVCFVAALGASLAVGPWTPGVPLPGALFSHLPLLDNLLPTRFGSLGSLALAALLAVGVDRVRSEGWSARTARSDRSRARGDRPTSRVTRRGAVVGLITAAALVPVMVDLPVTAGAGTRVPPRGNAVSASLAAGTPEGAVLLPVPPISQARPLPMLWQAAARMHWRSIGGYGIVPGRSGTGQMVPSVSATLAPLYGLARHAPQLAHGPASAELRHAEMEACRTLPGVIARYRVSTILVWHPRRYPWLVPERVVQAALGPPSFRQGRTAAWYRVAGKADAAGCRALG